MHTTCHVCLAPLGDPVLDTRSPFSLTSLCLRHAGPTLVHLCTACGHAQTPVMDDVEAYYEQSYRILLASEDEDQVVDMAGDRPVYRTPLQLDTLLRRVALPDGAGVLDYGCAKASTLRALLQRRPDLAGHVFDVSVIGAPNGNVAPPWSNTKSAPSGSGASAARRAHVRSLVGFGARDAERNEPQRSHPLSEQRRASSRR